jgi:F0F1-type ATP synthase assembly protein I
MTDSAETKRLPPLVAGILMSVSLALAISITNYLGTGTIGMIVGTLILMGVFALAYEFVFEQ